MSDDFIPLEDVQGPDYYIHKQCEHTAAIPHNNPEPVLKKLKHAKKKEKKI